LPPLEAMACGVPVICANTSSLPEVVGDAGVLIDPRDEGALASAMRRMAEDPAARADLSGKAALRAREFTWGRCADQTMAVYRSVAIAGVSA
jgi:glycosyltransferase involved in cell wall biosynthesis